MRSLIATLAALVVIGALQGQDAESTNYRTGISLTWGGTKGTAYQEEYHFHDKVVFDQKQVWIRDDTTITLSHNERNVAALNGSRFRTVVGASGGYGRIRYKFDGLWQKLLWAPWWDGSGTLYPAYSAPITLAGAGVVGVTGWNGSYYRGLIDSAGDEWHVMMYADDDSEFSGFPAADGADDSWASDGAYVLLVVNPKTPAATWRASGSGQFYTTPAWTYWVPKIHDQTTYIQGTVTCELRNIYGANISYDINGGSTVDVGAANVTLDQDDFSDGTNTLRYWYTATPSVKRTRTVVKNPTHPGLPESHGDRLWGTAAWSLLESRATRAPYAEVVTNAQTRSGTGHNGQANWDIKRRQGLVFGPSSNQWPHQNNWAATNATLAKLFGVTAFAPGAPGGKTYAEYAKEMLLETSLRQPNVGFELENWASMSLPCAATVYRGYWDVYDAYSAATAYDVLMGIYRSDQHAGGITPIEDYYIRDKLASWVHLCSILLGGFKTTVVADIPGLWSTSRNVGASRIAVVMPNYSTPYYGTSGMDGNTTVYQWAPYSTHNYTWRAIYVDRNNSLHSVRTGPYGPYGMTGPYSATASGPLIRPNLTVAYTGTNGEWVDRPEYSSWSQAGQHIAAYAHMIHQYSTIGTETTLLNFINEITAGTVLPSKWSSAPIRRGMITLLNSRFPQAAANATAWIQSGTAGAESESTLVRDAGFQALLFYDDEYFGGGAADTTPPTITITGPTSSATLSTSTTPLVISGTASDDVGVTSVTWTNAAGGSGSATGTSTWNFSAALTAGSNAITVRAYDAAGNSSTDVITVTYSAPAPTVPDAPTSLAATAVSATQINLTWVDNDDSPDETSFRIERSTTTLVGFTEIGSTSANVTSYSDTGLSASTTYYYRVRARNGDGDSSYTPEASATTPSAAGASMTVGTLNAETLIVAP